MSENNKGIYTALVDGIVKAVAAWAAPFLAYFAGRKSIEDELTKEQRNEAEKQLELELEHQRRTADPSERARVRQRFKKD
jgi:hypothetical protein